MTAIIMCTWKRINKLQQTIDLLNIQTNKDFTFFIWNNNSSIVNQVNKLTEQYKWIFVKHSPTNVGGIGRFYYAREINDKYDKIIFIDDDQIFKNTFVEDMLNNYEVKTIKSWYSWTFNSDDYFDRNKINNGENAHYCGTGICLIDSSAFNNDELFNNIPSEYAFIEDLWLSYFVTNILNWKAKGLIGVWGQIQKDGKDQFSKLRNKKNEFLKYLIHKKQWKLT